MNQPVSSHSGRRAFLRQGVFSLAPLALAGLDSSAARGAPLAPKSPMGSSRAKAVIHLFMSGAPSQLDLFDPKPELTRLEGKPLPPSVIGNQRYAFIRPEAGVLGPRFKFRRHGSSGADISEVFPYLGRIADRLCFIRSMKTEQFNHAPAQMLLQTGFSQPGRPSFGSWVVYGLGAETSELPAYMVLSTGAGISGGAALWSAGFLPGEYGGTRLRNQGDPILHLSNPPGITREAQRAALDLAAGLTKPRPAAADPETSTRLAAAEMAFRLQASAPGLFDLSGESRATLERYGCDPAKPSFARACLLARRMVERGVRFVTIFHEGWDAHSDVAGNLRRNAQATDQASAALVEDLAGRGMLDETLVAWGGEFGRTPMVETNPTLGRSLGRDHHPQAFTMWLAGGGVRPGITIGRTDELGFHVVERPVEVYDLQATMLHLLGLDHTRLTFHHAGRDFRLTDIHGQVVREALA
ncbi:MAG: DUF1501 domain-containing protein [Planctomycetes bacterium]|nr:DUF1501 domain-containing protein [Planctomycetota bacterium]